MLLKLIVDSVRFKNKLEAFPRNIIYDNGFQTLGI